MSPCSVGEVKRISGQRDSTNSLEFVDEKSRGVGKGSSWMNSLKEGSLIYTLLGRGTSQLPLVGYVLDNSPSVLYTR